MIRYLGAMLMSNYSLKYVDYPTSVLAKSVKPIPGTDSLHHAHETKEIAHVYVHVFQAQSLAHALLFNQHEVNLFHSISFS